MRRRNYAIVYIVITNELVAVTDDKLTFCQYIIRSLFFSHSVLSFAMVRVQFLSLKIVACMCHTITVERKMPMKTEPQ